MTSILIACLLGVSVALAQNGYGFFALGTCVVAAAIAHHEGRCEGRAEERKAAFERAVKDQQQVSNPPRMGL